MNERAKGTISVLLLDDSGRYVDPAARALGSEPDFMLVTSTLGHGEGLQTAKNLHPHVILLGGDTPDLPKVVEELDDGVPESAIVAILEEGREDLARQCTLAGARGYIFKFPQKEELVSSIRELYRRQTRRRSQLAATVLPGTNVDQGKIIAVHGAKGGVGATCIATNLAVATRKKTRQAVALIDANLEGGDVGVALNLLAPGSIADLVPHLKDLDGDLIRGTMVDHRSGVKVLLAPYQLERAEAITADELQRILGSMRHLFDYVFVDTKPFLDQVTFTALDMADHIVAVTTPEVPALKNAARFLQVCQQSGYPSAKVLLVVNRARSRGAISLNDIEKSVGHRIALSIPSDGKHLIKAVNQGDAIVTVRPRARVSKQLRGLSNILIDRGMVAKPEKARRWGRPANRGISRRALPLAEAE